MAQAILLLAMVGVTIYAAVDCLRTADRDVRGFPKPLWFLVIVGIPLAGGIGWIGFGRSHHLGRHQGAGPIVAPDDDPEFLRALEQKHRRAQRERREQERLQQQGEQPESQQHQEPHEPKDDGGEPTGQAAS